MYLQRQQDAKKIEEIRELFPSFVNDFISHRLFSLSPSSVLVYIYDIHDFFLWMMRESHTKAEEIYQITLQELEALREVHFTYYMGYLQNREEEYKGRKVVKQKNSKRTISRKLSGMRSFFDFLSDHENPETEKPYLSKNILAKLKVSSEKHSAENAGAKLEDKILMESEVAGFIDYIYEGYGEYLDGLNRPKAYDNWAKFKYRDAGMISLLLGSGLRVGELISIRFKDLHIDERYILVSRKGDTNAKVSFSKRAQKDLHTYLSLRPNLYPNASDQAMDFLFLTKYQKNYKVISKNAVQKIVMRYAEGYGKKLTAHGLRHTFGTHLYQKTHDIRGVQSALGHSKIETTQIYTHVFKNQVRDLIDKAFD
jgi:site-specific recombinase XerD